VLLAEEEGAICYRRKETASPFPTPSSVIDTTLFNFAEELSFAESFRSSRHYFPSVFGFYNIKAAKAGAVPLGAVTALVAVGQIRSARRCSSGIVLCGGAIVF